MKTIPHAVPITELDADAIVIPVLAEPSLPGGATHAVDRALGGLVGRLHARGDLDAAVGRVTPLFAEGGIAAPRVLVVGLGSAAALDAEAVRRAAAAALRRARAFGAKRVGVAPLGAGLADLDFAAAAAATVEGARLGLYRYAQDRGVDELMLAVDEARLEAAHDAVRWAEAVAEGVELARELVNRPPNVATPQHLADVARALAEDHGFRATIGDRAWAAEHGMGAFLGVAQGAGHEPRFIVLEHDPTQGQEAPLVLVGKGVTFDSGGVSIKGRQGMEKMKGDMAGAAAVLGAMRTLGRLRTARRVVAIVPATENMPDAHAYRPADVLTAANGTTIEIISTDAEGRLLLADALVYAARYRPRAVVDLATLTGAVVGALGEGIAAGRFANDAALAAQIDAAGDATFERVWPLPLWPEYREDLRSDVADLKNSSGKPRGGASVAATFLERFVDYPWVHLDIAGMAQQETEKGYVTKGATGFGVRLLVRWVTRA
jgi:leucyl aminopeptidase